MATKLREALQKLGPALANRLRLDAWANNVTGFGTTRDKTTYTAFLGVEYLADEQIANLYHGDDLAARMVDIVPDEMLREGFEVDTEDPGLNDEIADQLEALGAREKLANGIRWGRLFGGGALLIGADDNRPASSPLVPERARGVSYLYELDRRMLWPLTYYAEPGHPKLGQPETFMVAPASAHAGGNYSIVHETRLILFGGATTGIREKQVNQGWDLSVLQRPFEALRSFNTGWKAVELMLTDANQAVFKMSGLAEAIQADGETIAKSRMAVIDMYRSVMRAIVVDAGDPANGDPGEDFTRHSASFADIPATLDKFMLRLAAAVQIPVTILMGQSPAGMNATGDSDFRWFYDRIRSQQMLMLAPRVRRLVRVMLRTRDIDSGERKVSIKFPPLWTLDPLQEAQRQQAIATADAAYVAAGVFMPEEIALARAKPEGFDQELILDDEAREARKRALKAGLEDLTDPLGDEPDEADADPAATLAAQARQIAAEDDDGDPPPQA